MKIKTITALLALASAGVIAAPTGGTFRPGTGSGTIATGPTTTVQVDTAAGVGLNQNGTAVIDWASFNVANGEAVNFIHNVANANGLTIVNVDNAGVMSHVNGAISTALGANAPAGARTNIVLVNPNGVSIGATAAINTSGAFIAAAGTADTATPTANNNSGAPIVTVRLNSSPVTIDMAASITAGATGQNSYVNFMGGGPVATLPAYIANTGAVGLDTTLDLSTGAAAGQVYNMTSSRANGVAFTVTQGDIVNLTSSTLGGTSAVNFYQPGGTQFTTGTLNLDGVTIAPGGTFLANADTGSTLSVSNALTLGAGAGLDFRNWFGLVDFQAGSAIAGAGGNTAKFRWGGIGSGPVNISNTDLSFTMVSGTTIAQHSSTFTSPTDFYTGVGQLAINVTGGSVVLNGTPVATLPGLPVPAVSPGVLSNADIHADTITATVAGVKNTNLTTTGTTMVQAVNGTANLGIGENGSTVNVTGLAVRVNNAGGDVDIGANATLKSTQGSSPNANIVVQGSSSVTYLSGSRQLAQDSNIVVSPTVTGSSQLENRTALQQNPGTLPGSTAVNVSGQNVTIAGTLIAGTPPALPPVTPPVTEPVTPPVVTPPVTEPVTPPVLTPPVTEPVTPPVVTPPVTEPVTPPVVTPPVTEPVTPPVVTPPVTEPVTPPVVTPPAVRPMTVHVSDSVETASIQGLVLELPAGQPSTAGRVTVQHDQE